MFDFQKRDAYPVIGTGGVVRYTREDLPDLIEKAHAASSLHRLSEIYPRGENLGPIHLENTLKYGKVLISGMLVGAIELVPREERDRLFPQGYNLLDSARGHAEAREVWLDMVGNFIQDTPETTEMLFCSLRAFLECLELIGKNVPFESWTDSQKTDLGIMKDFFKRFEEKMMIEMRSIPT